MKVFYPDYFWSLILASFPKSSSKTLPLVVHKMGLENLAKVGLSGKVLKNRRFSQLLGPTKYDLVELATNLP
eukprot:SAG11_NODE_7106_length_1192_cov_5.351327_1_plen_71_part_10